jgi:hypothetical protein
MAYQGRIGSNPVEPAIPAAATYGFDQIISCDKIHSAFVLPCGRGVPEIADAATLAVDQHGRNPSKERQCGHCREPLDRHRSEDAESSEEEQSGRQIGCRLRYNTENVPGIR